MHRAFISLLSTAKPKKTKQGFVITHMTILPPKTIANLHFIPDSDDGILMSTNNVLYDTLLTPSTAGQGSDKSYLALLLWLVAHNPVKEQPFHMCFMPWSDQLHPDCV